MDTADSPPRQGHLPRKALAGMIAALTLALTNAPAQTQRASRPNIIFIMTAKVRC